MTRSGGMAVAFRLDVSDWLGSPVIENRRAGAGQLGRSEPARSIRGLKLKASRPSGV
jgi:hypothetical protein